MWDEVKPVGTQGEQKGVTCKVEREGRQGGGGAESGEDVTERVFASGIRKVSTGRDDPIKPIPK